MAEATIYIDPNGEINHEKNRNADRLRQTAREESRENRKGAGHISNGLHPARADGNHWTDCFSRFKADILGVDEQ